MIESLTDWISMWIVRHGCRLLDVIHGVKFRDYCIFKTSALIAGDACQNPIDIEQFVNLDLGDSKCLLVVSNEGLTELVEGTSQYQVVLFTVFWWVNFQKIYTQQAQEIIGNMCPLVCLWTCIMTLCDMAPMTVGDIFGYILVHYTPIKSFSY